MTGPDVFDDTAVDHERFETKLVARDCDVARGSTADIDETTARHRVSELVDGGVVTAIPEQRALVHEPSGEAFDSIRQLAVFHYGWTAAHIVGEEAE